MDDKTDRPFVLPTRLNNPENKSKTEAEHIAHVTDRLKERFEIDITNSEYFDLLKLVQTQSKHLYRLNRSNSVKRIVYKGKEMLAVFGTGSTNSRQIIPSRVKTVLYPDKDYPVPDELLRQSISQAEFTKQAKEVAESIVAFATSTMPNITSRELYTSPEYAGLSQIFKCAVKKYHNGILKPDDLLIMGFKMVIEKYDTQTPASDTEE